MSDSKFMKNWITFGILIWSIFFKNSQLFLVNQMLLGHLKQIHVKSVSIPCGKCFLQPTVSNCILDNLTPQILNMHLQIALPTKDMQRQLRNRWCTVSILSLQPLHNTLPIPMHFPFSPMGRAPIKGLQINIFIWSLPLQAQSLLTIRAHSFKGQFTFQPVLAIFS